MSDGLGNQEKALNLELCKKKATKIITTINNSGFFGKKKSNARSKVIELSKISDPINLGILRELLRDKNSILSRMNGITMRSVFSNICKFKSNISNEIAVIISEFENKNTDNNVILDNITNIVSNENHKLLHIVKKFKNYNIVIQNKFKDINGVVDQHANYKLLAQLLPYVNDQHTKYLYKILITREAIKHNDDCILSKTNLISQDEIKLFFSDKSFMRNISRDISRVAKVIVRKGLVDPSTIVKIGIANDNFILIESFIDTIRDIGKTWEILCIANKSLKKIKLIEKLDDFDIVNFVKMSIPILMASSNINITEEMVTLMYEYFDCDILFNVVNGVRKVEPTQIYTFGIFMMKIVSMESFETVRYDNAILNFIKRHIKLFLKNYGGDFHEYVLVSNENLWYLIDNNMITQANKMATHIVKPHKKTCERVTKLIRSLFSVPEIKISNFKTIKPLILLALKNKQFNVHTVDYNFFISVVEKSLSVTSHTIAKNEYHKIEFMYCIIGKYPGFVGEHCKTYSYILDSVNDEEISRCISFLFSTKRYVKMGRIIQTMNNPVSPYVKYLSINRLPTDNPLYAILATKFGDENGFNFDYAKIEKFMNNIFRSGNCTEVVLKETNIVPLRIMYPNNALIGHILTIHFPKKYKGSYAKLTSLLDISSNIKYKIAKEYIAKINVSFSDIVDLVSRINKLGTSRSKLISIFDKVYEKKYFHLSERIVVVVLNMNKSNQSKELAKYTVNDMTLIYQIHHNNKKICRSLNPFYPDIFPNIRTGKFEYEFSKMNAISKNDAMYKKINTKLHKFAWHSREFEIMELYEIKSKFYDPDGKLIQYNNNKWLFHGTNTRDKAMGISKTGFCIEKAGSYTGRTYGVGAFGNGAYLTPQTCKASNYIDDGTNEGWMIIAIYSGNQLYRATKEKGYYDYSNDVRISNNDGLFHSKGVIFNHEEYCFYESQKIKPIFAIRFKKISEDTKCFKK
jgi:hypothetical protein